MRKKISEIGFAIALTLCFVAIGAGALVGSAQNKTLSPEWSVVDISRSYDIGTEFRVPKRTLALGGTTVDAGATLEFPDGSATRATTVKLSSSGNYTVRYSAVAGGKTYVKNEKFSVQGKLFTFSGSGSTAEYGLYGQAGVTTEGIMVRLARGETMDFAPVIDLKKLTKTDSVVTLFATPDNIGNADFKLLYFTLTDVTDPSIYLRVSVRGVDDDPNYSYMLAGASTQGTMVGLEHSKGVIHRDNGWGTATSHSFYGANVYGKPIDTSAMRLQLDMSTMTVSVSKNSIADLDDTKYFSKLFAGFPSDRVRLSVSASDYNNPTANFCVTQFFGMDSVENTDVYDVEPPVITIDTGSADRENMPKAKIGGTYPVPAATAYDYGTGKRTVRTTVWYNYFTDAPISITSVGGRFATEYPGMYTVVYEAEDNEGNETKEIVWVNAVSDVAPVRISADHSSAKKSAVLGEYVETPSFSVDGGSGKTTVKIAATNGDSVYETDGTQLRFRPEKEGVYTVAYTATDYIGQTATASYEVTVSRGDAPVFVEKPKLPKYFISGYDYKMPEYYANDYTSGSSEHKAASAKVRDSGGEKSVAAGDVFTPVVQNNGDTVTVTFTCGNAEPYVAEIPCILAYEVADGAQFASLKLENYFVSENLNVTATDEYCLFTATTADGGWTFANPLIAENMQLQIRGVNGKSNYSALRIRFEDSANENVAVEARLVNTDDYLYFETDGGRIRMDNDFKSGALHTVKYSGKEIYFDAMSVAPVTTISGEKFVGFPSDKIYLSIRFEDAESGAQYRISALDNQPMRKLDTDRIPPRIVFLEPYGGEVKIGDRVTLPAVVAGDVLTPDTEFTLTVLGPDRKPMTDINGTVLRGVDPSAEYTVEITDYGQYNVSYTATDTNESMSAVMLYNINVVDDEPPAITFAHAPNTEAKAGDVLVIPKFTASDNLTAADDLIIVQYVRTPRGRLVALNNGSNSVRADSEGKYAFYIYVSDEAGNVTLESFTVTVTR